MICLLVLYEYRFSSVVVGKWRLVLSLIVLWRKRL